jgi:hypothetical protein
VQHVFDPQTRDRANGKPRILISDGFGTHESLELMKFCYENHVILCRIPSHTDRVLQEMHQARPEIRIAVPTESNLYPCDELMTTPVTSESLTVLFNQIEKDTRALDGPCKHRLRKLADAAEKVFAERALLRDENQLLFSQNNEKRSRQLAGSKIAGTAKVMGYDDILEAQKKRREKVGAAERSKRRQTASSSNKEPNLQRHEKEKAEREIQGWDIAEYCSVLQF